MFLWEVAPDEEFGYESIAAEYFSSVTAVQKGAALMALHANPVYFYRKGRGNYKRRQKTFCSAHCRLSNVSVRKRNVVKTWLRRWLPENCRRILPVVFTSCF